MRGLGSATSIICCRHCGYIQSSDSSILQYLDRSDISASAKLKFVACGENSGGLTTRMRESFDAYSAAISPERSVLWLLQMMYSKSWWDCDRTLLMHSSRYGSSL